MSRRYFGTDGVRGTVGTPPMTVDFALRLASAAARVLAPDGGTVLIGKDTRLSGYMFEAALEAGFTAAGVDVLLVGPLPTPGVAYLCRELGAEFGLVISASHNLYDDNGIKIFAAGGEKLSDVQEQAIEALLDEPPLTRESAALGRARRVDHARIDYQEFCKTMLPQGTDLGGFKLVIDCAHGAAYKVAPRVLAELGAEIIPIGCSPNGRNINQGCGSTQPELLATTVSGVGACMGIALDGDGDRCVLVDTKGKLVDGDQILFILARDAAERGELRGPVVGTVMSNLGLQQALEGLGIDFRRAAVGDRNVMAMLRQAGGQLGGETSGHIINLARTSTGDGLATALQVLEVMRRTGRSLADLAGDMPRLPQVMINVRVAQRLGPDAEAGVAVSVERAEQTLGDDGRVVLRASGTEPVIRVMVEARDAAQARTTAEQLAEVVRAAAGH
ncbi:phosphoglucosamine mutase [Thioalkalivibrio sp. XN279]|uniref:phosphoglucosamine mutase n=1 Tax=Thioalkalivibrio sp. XN279 TaxID=2714953 RepID=UPI0014081902|nr:phosphoglucosamine mutase [Thioalkalivibrio sp. XN279]NHA14570.1 phosphoglucosamine mutase [Thioalkalivibrio sp. XN279]